MFLENLSQQATNGGQWCWWQRYVDKFLMVTNLRCRWQNHTNRQCWWSSVILVSFWMLIGHQHLKLVIKIFRLQHPSLMYPWKVWQHTGNPSQQTVIFSQQLLLLVQMCCEMKNLIITTNNSGYRWNPKQVFFLRI